MNPVGPTSSLNMVASNYVVTSFTATHLANLKMVFLTFCFAKGLLGMAKIFYRNFKDF